MSREELIDHDDSGTSNPALSATEHDPPPPPPSPRPALQPLRISTNSGLTYLPGDDAYIAANLALHTTTLSSPLGSPRPYSSRLAPRHPALRRATLLMRASRSAASLQHKTSPTAQVAAPWPAPPPSRSQSLNFQQPPEPSPPLPSPFPPRTLSYSSESGAAEMNPDGSLTPAGLSWRRLHVSRAKLKATATTSELLSGFAMVAMVELQINEDTKVPEWLFVLFSICTTVLVAVHIFALMISTYILPSIDAVSRLHSPGGGEAAELVAESPHERLRWFIELAWAFSTVLGLFLFLVEVAILCWVKFWDYSFAAALASTAIVVPALAVFVGFAVHFYHTLVVHKCEASDNDLKQLERIKQQLDAVKPGV